MVAASAIRRPTAESDRRSRSTAPRGQAKALMRRPRLPSGLVSCPRPTPSIDLVPDSVFYFCPKGGQVVSQNLEHLGRQTRSQTPPILSPQRPEGAWLPPPHPRCLVASADKESANRLVRNLNPARVRPVCIMRPLKVHLRFALVAPVECVRQLRCRNLDAQQHHVSEPVC